MILYINHCSTCTSTAVCKPTGLKLQGCVGA